MTKHLLIIAALFSLFFGCSSAPQEITDDITENKLLQMAQESILKDNNSDNAIYYYTEFIKRFPGDSKRVIEAEYEIAYIHYTKKDYETAIELFNNILFKYEDENAVILPQWPYILTNKVLADINLILAPKEEKKETTDSVQE